MDARSNTVARFNLLKRALAGGTNIPSSLFAACKSQSGLAKLALPLEQINPMSLNTLKVRADDVIEEGGWKKLDNMRRSYLQMQKTDAQRARSRAGKDRKAQSKAREESLRDALDLERRYRIRLQVAYDELLARVRQISKTDSEVANYINRHVAGFSFKRFSIAKGGQREE